MVDFLIAMLVFGGVYAKNDGLNGTKATDLSELHSAHGAGTIFFGTSKPCKAFLRGI